MLIFLCCCFPLLSSSPLRPLAGEVFNYHYYHLPLMVLKHLLPDRKTYFTNTRSLKLNMSQTSQPQHVQSWTMMSNLHSPNQSSFYVPLLSREKQYPLNCPSHIGVNLWIILLIQTQYTIRYQMPLTCIPLKPVLLSLFTASSILAHVILFPELLPLPTPILPPPIH